MQTARETPFDLPDCATTREILAQPAIWRGWGANIAAQVADLRNWIADSGASEIWLSGAGTSAFIGDLVAAGLGASQGVAIRAVASTDLVSAPRSFLRAGVRPLVISFGRSGNSAESIGTLDVLDALAPDAPRLNITCNAGSILATRQPASGAQRLIVLPGETHDAGFAMTSSYTTMLLSALALLDDDATAAVAPRFDGLAKAADRLLPALSQWARAQPVAERIVFVGSGALSWAARESALKVMELTAGQTPALWDSSLGFRHGPKSFVTPGTHVVSLISSDPYTARYDNDLASELATQFPGISRTRIGPDKDADIGFQTGFTDHWNAPLYVLAAQLLSVYWSARLGLNVDDPFAGQGTLTRVVSGVKLYAPGDS
jgi:D-galactosamine 6-phosphate deaminase/isomerase